MTSRFGKVAVLMGGRAGRGLPRELGLRVAVEREARQSARQLSGRAYTKRSEGAAADAQHE